MDSMAGICLRDEQALDPLSPSSVGHEPETITDQIRGLAELNSGRVGVDMLTSSSRLRANPAWCLRTCCGPSPSPPWVAETWRTHTMVLLEPMVEQRQIDLKEIRENQPPVQA